MFIDLRQHLGTTHAEADICIIGAGAAGITLARELSGRTFTVAVLESGGFTYEPTTQALYKGDSIGLRYGELDETRFRYFGGSTNPEGWGGWLKPLDRNDFVERPWVPHSGWPFDWGVIEPWYWRAQTVCEGGPFDYDLESWRTHLHRPLADLPFSTDRVVTEINQLSVPTRFGARYRDEIAAAGNVTVYLHANALEIVMDRDGSTAQRVEAVSLDGQKLSVAARTVVLAAGGVENPRLLLASRSSSRTGIGNEYDLVGRFFMDHPSLELGTLDLPHDIPSDLYDPYYKFRRRNRALRGVYDESLIAGSLALTPEVQREAQILGYRAWVVAAFPGDGTQASDALKRLYIAARDRQVTGTTTSDLRQVLRRPDHAASIAVGRLLRPRRLIRGHRLVNILEPEQLPESRIMLADDTDALGQQRVRLDWQVGRLVHRTLADAHEIIDEELKRSGLGRLSDPYRLGEDERFLDALGWVWHHMGTTRMHEDPAHGVVDADCRVHSTSNVYVAGSSVFPTPGTDAPTLTIVALALRLANHLRSQLDGAAAEPVG